MPSNKLSKVFSVTKIFCNYIFKFSSACFMNNSPYWLSIMHGCLSADSIDSKRQTVFGEWSSRKTVSFEEQIVSRDKYLCIFVCKMEANLSFIFQILFQCTGEKPLKLYASIMTCSFSLPTQCFVFSSTGLHAELIQKDKRNKHTSYIAGIS